MSSQPIILIYSFNIAKKVKYCQAWIKCEGLREKKLGELPQIGFAKNLKKSSSS